MTAFTPRRRLALQCAAALALPRLAGAQSASASGPEALIEALPERLRAAQVPGLSWAFVERGVLRHHGAWGLADLSTQRALRADTLLGTASVTKVFTGALLLQLVEQGRCALDDDAQLHLPFALRHPAHPERPITLRHLLTHTSSLADAPAAYAASYACGDPAQRMGDWLREALHGPAAQAAPPFHPEAPGQRHAYSNVGYGLLGLVVERLQGKPWASCLHESLLAPLGMVRSRVLLQGLDAEARARELAVPHEFLPAGKDAAEPVSRLALGAPQPLSEGQGALQPLCAYSFATQSDGLLRSSAPELARFALALLQGGELDGRRILRRDSLAELFRDQLGPLPASARPRYIQGLTWRGLGEGEARHWAHFGSDPGTAAALALRPRDGRAIALLANGGRARPLLGRLVAEWMAA